MSFRGTFRLLIAMTGVVLSVGLGPPVGGGEFDPPVRLRRPVAMALAENDARLYTANRASGSITTIDLHTGTAIDEIDIGRTLADLAMTPDGSYLLAVDEASDSLIVLVRAEESLRVVSRTPIAQAPVSVRVSADGKRCFVASLWGRAVSVIDLRPLQDRSDAPTGDVVLLPREAIPLPFSPRLMTLAAQDTRLVVADAFGGSLAVIDLETKAVVSVRELVGHNIRGMTTSSDGGQLLLAHQILNSNVDTSQRNIFWGAVMTNVLRTLPMELLTADVHLPFPPGSTQTIGGLGTGAGDPAGVAVSPAGDIVVALSGVQEVAIRRAGQNGWQRESVGRRPIAVALSGNADRIYVASTFADAISVVDMDSCTKEQTISLGPRPQLSTAERGEMLFYDARLSFDGWYSCHSCHTDGHTNGLTSDNFGDGSAGAAKRVLSLLGTADTGPWAWDGHVARLEDQVRGSLQATMRSHNVKDDNVAALTAYLRTLPAPPKERITEGEQIELIAAGRAVFERSGCSQCHQSATYTSAGAYDVGLADELGRNRFNPPSLRGVRWRERLFHDNRAAMLTDVVRQFGHGSEGDLSTEEAAALVAFLRSL
ncbi:MAG TPA: cytochrome c peroxidase [Pirellulales bacterium]|jgi:cytochrome c peroxidase